MRSAVKLLIVVATVVAEAPYHLPRPAPHAPPFGYPSVPAFPPVPYPHLPQPRPTPQPFPHPAPVPQPSYPSGQGYNYQQPNFGPAFIHPAPQPVPQPIPTYHPPPPVHLPAPLPQPLPISYPQPIPVTYPQPQPLPVHHPRPQPIPIPQSSYGLPQPQPQPQPQLQPQPLPNYFYNLPQSPAAPTAPSIPQSQSYVQQTPISLPQIAIPLPLQPQPLTNNGLSSYQADSNQYTTAQAQTHGEALDQTVVSHVQNIIRDSEHTSAKNAGYLSLVSGVTLENAKPSVEISSFVHNSPQSDAGLLDIRSGSSSAAQSSAASAVSVSSSYDTPTLPASNTQSSDTSTSLGFLPNNKPGNSYGIPT